MTELQSGVVLGRYELLVRIGRGGMASVWVARERSAVSGKERLVAVKAMLPELAAHSEFRSMFLREVQLVQSINHDNVVRVYEVSEDRGTLYMAMEWVEGDSLRNLIRAAKSRGALPSEIAVRIAADAAAGLHAAHELRDWDGELRGVVHCDVSPHNILVGIDGKAKLVDFGIANALGHLGQSGDTEKIKGKLSYMSPEQARGEPLDRRTDVFALGIVLFELTTGEQLFKGRDAAHTLELVRNGAIPRPSRLNPRYPKLLEGIVMRALDRNPGRRYQTAAELEQDLTAFLYQERILVSHAAVAQLLVRVTGQRIEKRRDVISRVIQAVDGQLQTGEPSSRPLASLAELAPVHSDPFNYTLTNVGDESMLGIAARLESHTVVGHPISSATSNAFSSAPPEEPVLIEPDTPRRPWLWLSAVAALLVLGALVAYVLLYRAREPEIQAVALQAPSTTVSTVTANATPTSREVDRLPERVQSAESLPVAGDPTSDVHSVAPRKGSKGKRGAEGEPEESPATLPAEPEEKTAQPEPAQGKTGASEVPAEPEEKKAPEAGIDRAAANAALANAAAAASSCRSQGETPTGQGRAAVTFAPDGSAVAVSLSQRFTGTAIGACVAAQFRQARAPAFSGDSVTLFYSFDIPQ